MCGRGGAIWRGVSNLPGGGMEGARSGGFSLMAGSRLSTANERVTTPCVRQPTTNSVSISDSRPTVWDNCPTVPRSCPKAWNRCPTVPRRYPEQFSDCPEQFSGCPEPSSGCPEQSSGCPEPSSAWKTQNSGWKTQNSGCPEQSSSRPKQLSGNDLRIPRIPWRRSACSAANLAANPSRLLPQFGPFPEHTNARIELRGCIFGRHATRGFDLVSFGSQQGL